MVRHVIIITKDMPPVVPMNVLYILNVYESAPYSTTQYSSAYKQPAIAEIIESSVFASYNNINISTTTRYLSCITKHI